MAMARESMEAAHDKKNGNALMVDSPKALFVSTLLATCLDAAATGATAAAGKPQEYIFHSPWDTFSLVLRIYEYVPVSDSLDDLALYIFLGLLHYAIHEGSI